MGWIHPVQWEKGQNQRWCIKETLGESTTNLCGQALISAVGQQETDDAVVILLGRHVERSEPILRLDIDGGALEHQDLDNFFLSGFYLNHKNKEIVN